MDCKRIVRSLVGSVYQALINNAERGAYVEHMIVLALEGWELTWPWASWDLQHRGDGARIEVKQSAARQTWHKRPKSPESPPVPKPSPGKFGINKPSENYYLEDGTYEETPPQRHADIYVFAWHPEKDLEIADHRRPDQWKFFVVAERCLPRQKDIALGPLEKLVNDCDFAEFGDYEALPAMVAKVLESIPEDRLKLRTRRVPRKPSGSDNGVLRCAVTRRHSSAGANPARQLSLQPVAVGADDGGNDIG